MGTEVMARGVNARLLDLSQSSATLEAELETARATLRDVDDNIKKVFGKDATELVGFQRGGRQQNSDSKQQQSIKERDGDVNHGGGWDRGGRRAGILDSNRLGRKVSEDGGRDNAEPMSSRWGRQDSSRHGQVENRSDRDRPAGPMVIASRLRPGRGSYDESDEEERHGQHNAAAGRNHMQQSPGFNRQHHKLHSRIVSATKEKSRDEVLAEQRSDRSGRDRNKRMFGALLGTLHRFKQDETKLKEKEEKRAQIEAKLDEAEREERESVKKQKQQLIRDRKLKLTEIKRLEIKKRRIDELDEWEQKTRCLKNFIRTESEPHIYWRPKVLNPVTECKLEESKMLVDEMITTRRQEVYADLESYEQRSKRYWDNRLGPAVGGEAGDEKPNGGDEEMEVDGNATTEKNNSASSKLNNIKSNTNNRRLTRLRVPVHPLDENMEDELKELMKDEDFEDDEDEEEEDIDTKTVVDRNREELNVVSNKMDLDTEIKSADKTENEQEVTNHEETHEDGPTNTNATENSGGVSEQIQHEEEDL